ncbi:MAG: RNA polymerase sigma factor [bacterium]
MLSLLKSGSRDAFEKVYLDHRDGVYAYCVKILLDRHLAKDIVQDTFLKVRQHAVSLQQTTSLKSWIYRIARNEALMHLPKKRHNTTGHFMIDRAYVIAVENILSGNYTTKWHTGYIWITLFGLLLAGIVAYRFSPIQSALIIFLITILSIALCSYLFEQYDVVVDVLYPSLSLGIAMFLFPLLLLAIRYRLNRTEAF